MKEIQDSAFELAADLVLLAMGFVCPRHNGLVEQSGVALDPRKNVKANTLDYKTSVQKVFACGDMRRGQSLVVWAIREGRQCARAWTNSSWARRNCRANVRPALTKSFPSRSEFGR